MIERVADDGIVTGEQRFKHAAVGIEAGSIKDGVFRAEEFSNLFFQLLVHVARSADETDR